MPTVIGHDGAEIYFEVHGTGPALFAYATPRPPRGPLGGPSRALKERLIFDVASRYRVVLLDYPGIPKPGTLTPGNVTRDLLAVADAAGLDSFAWYGYSWGAVIGLQLAVASDRVSALVAGGFPPLDGPYAGMLTISETLLSKAERLPYVRLPLPRKVRRGLEQWVTYYAGLQDYDDRAAQAQLTMPRLCFVGSNDVFRLNGRELANLAGRVMDNRDELARLGWQVDVLDGCNHRTAMNPDVVVPRLLRFLDENVGKTEQAIGTAE